MDTDYRLPEHTRTRVALKRRLLNLKLSQHRPLRAARDSARAGQFKTFLTRWQASAAKPINSTMGAVFSNG